MKESLLTQVEYLASVSRIRTPSELRMKIQGYQEELEVAEAGKVPQAFYDHSPVRAKDKVLEFDRALQSYLNKFTSHHYVDESGNEVGFFVYENYLYGFNSKGSGKAIPLKGYYTLNHIFRYGVASTIKSIKSNFKTVKSIKTTYEMRIRRDAFISTFRF